MKVKILMREGRTYPLLFCDLCDKLIDGSENAEYLIPEVPEGEHGDIIVGHYACTDPYEKKQYKATGEVMGNMSLGHLLHCLVTNTKTDIAKEKEIADQLDLIG